jgi:DNA-binding response OmpR family regulator
MSGIELRSRLIEAGLSQPVIFITARDDANTRESTHEAASCLTKPFTGRALILAIDAALVSKESMQPP